eukprot:15025080-Alexandrium_andersonii.AAC.1
MPTEAVYLQDYTVNSETNSRSKFRFSKLLFRVFRVVLDHVGAQRRASQQHEFCKVLLFLEGRAAELHEGLVARASPSRAFRHTQSCPGSQRIVGARVFVDAKLYPQRPNTKPKSRHSSRRHVHF